MKKGSTRATFGRTKKRYAISAPVSKEFYEEVDNAAEKLGVLKKDLVIAAVKEYLDKWRLPLRNEEINKNERI